MAGILVRLHQTATRLLAMTNLKARHLGWVDADSAILFKRDDGSEYGDAHLIPSTIGQGMGRRITQAAHGFPEKWLVYFNGAAWVSADATSEETFATHMVVRVISSSVFEIASTGSWTFAGGAPVGPFYLSSEVPGTMFSSPMGAVQRVGSGDGTTYHLAIGNHEMPAPEDPALNDLTDVDTTGSATGDMLRLESDGQWRKATVTVATTAPSGTPAASDVMWIVVDP